jgi:predicted transcriptional regulator
MPAKSKTSISDILEAFHLDETFKNVALRLGVSPNRLRVMWKEAYGDEAFKRRAQNFCKDAGPLARKEALKAFHTEEPFKVLAKRLGMSPNTVRDLWKQAYGEKAFKDRGTRLQAKGAVEYGKTLLGKSKPKRFVEIFCQVCGSPIEKTALQIARSSDHLCPKCLGLDQLCPVCNLPCGGLKGLSGHVHRAKDEAHRDYLLKEEALKWEGLKEGLDFAVCLLCGHRSQSLARHLLAEHKINADQYRMQFPGALIRSEYLTEIRSEAIKASHVVTPRKGLTKTILCSNCDCELEVSAFFAYATHNSRCPSCKQAGIEAEDTALWEDKSEPEDYVTCQVCGHRAENLTSHVSSEHCELVGRYEALHPNSKLVALNSKVRDKTALKGSTVSDATKALMSRNAGRWNKGLIRETDERMLTLSEHCKGRPGWNKGLTKETHSGLQITSEKLSALKTGVPNDAARLDLSLVDFTPYLDEAGTVDRKAMAEGLSICEPTVTKYMEALGLSISQKYVDTRVEKQFIRLEKEDLLPFRLANGKVVIAQAMIGLKRSYSVIKRECFRYGLETFNHRIRQTLCLDAISKALGGVSYEQEWKSWKFVNPLSGHRFRFDGYYTSHDLIVEFNGYQHWVFPSIYVKNPDVFKALQERDRLKESLVRKDPVLRYFLVREDEPYTDVEYLRSRLIEEGLLNPGK